MSFRSAREDTAPLHLTHDRYKRSRPDKTNPLAMMDFLVRLVEGRSLTEAVLISTGSRRSNRRIFTCALCVKIGDAMGSSAHIPGTRRVCWVTASMCAG